MGLDIDDYEMLIFDRWGEIIFRSTNPDLGWNGASGKGDTYIYKIEFKDRYSVERHKYSGKIILIK